MGSHPQIRKRNQGFGLPTGPCQVGFTKLTVGRVGRSVVETSAAVSSRASSRATSPVRGSEKLSQARASAQRAKEQLDGAMQSLAAKVRVHSTLYSRHVSLDVPVHT